MRFRPLLCVLHARPKRARRRRGHKRTHSVKEDRASEERHSSHIRCGAAAEVGLAAVTPENESRRRGVRTDTHARNYIAPRTQERLGVGRKHYQVQLRQARNRKRRHAGNAQNGAGGGPAEPARPLS